MTDDARTDPAQRQLAGRTVLSGRALQHLALGLVRDAARVPARDVSLSFSDDKGMLKAEITLPVVLAAGVERSLVQRAAALREAVTEGMASLAGRSVSAVDVRFSGVREVQGRRAV